ncbi:helix-turn-helix domain-containing protein [Streptomyces sp. NBC_00234]|uniref:helix-turn-helix domain-containing protein n=1 Tax=Streptomyces sp. NBC_00234 TaxID=2903638 RepID=UPI002E2D8EAD|nr:helix-turn-helix domain-containing protein [Streptomyces sp. NBC_00234]
MGRQEQPLDLDQGPVARFAYELRELRRRAGSPPYRRLAARAHYSASTLAAAAAGRRLPSATVLAAFVTACGGDPAEWEQRRVRTHRLITSPPPLPPEAPPGDGTPGYSAGTPDQAADLAALARLPASRASVTVTPSRATPPEEISEPIRSTASAPGDSAAEPHSAVPDPAPAPGAAPDSVTPPPGRSGRSGRPDRLISGRMRAARLRTAGLTALIVLAAVLLTVGVFRLGDRGATHADAGPEGSGKPARTTTPAVFHDGAHLLRTDAGIPRAYRHLIIEAGTLCDTAEITPALVAAILKAESDFDPTLSDPAKDEYGIARWTPRVLRYYLPPERQNAVPRPPFSPEDSISALGRMLCAIAPDLVGVPGDPALHLAAAYRTATWVVQQQGAQLRSIQPYLTRVRTHLEHYRPQVRN